MKQPFLEAGRIVSTFGIRGEVKIEPWCDSAEFLQGFSVLYVQGKPREVASARVHKGMLIVRFQDVEDVNTAMALKGKVVSFRREDAKLPADRVFIADILGSTVLDESGREVGRLEDVLVLPAGNVYVVRGEREHMIPAVPEFILETDPEQGVTGAYDRGHVI